MKTQTKHTALPWRVGTEDFDSTNSFISAGKDYLQLVTVHSRNTKEETEANAEFIVKACNNHYQLLEACKNLLGFMDSYVAEINDSKGMDLQEDISDFISDMRKAINQAEGK